MMGQPKKRTLQTGRFILLGAAWLALAGVAEAQRAVNWRVYRTADGLPESACASVSLGGQGKIITTHPGNHSASELDGFGVTTIAEAPTNHGRIYESPAGQL